MGKTLSDLINECLKEAKDRPSTRENSIVITKLQEALLWDGEFKKNLTESAARAGVGMSHDITRPHNQIGPQMTGENDPSAVTPDKPIEGVPMGGKSE